MERLAFIRQSIEQFCRIPDDFSWDTTFEELGMDSYAIVDFLLALEEKIGFAADDAELLSQNCMRDVEDLIARCMEEDNTIMLKGIAASQGIAIAKVYKLEPPVLDIKRIAAEPRAELAKLGAAFKKTIEDVQKIKEVAAKSLAPEELAVFDAHLMMANDPELRTQIEDMINNERSMRNSLQSRSPT